MKMKIKYTCAKCGEVYALNGFTNHIQRTHKMPYKTYYDTYIDPTEHVCPYCGKQCAFTNHHGYYDTCNDPTCVRKLQHETMRARYGKACRHADKIKPKRQIIYKFCCALCGHGYMSLLALNRHLNKKHTDITVEQYYNKYMGIAPGKCEICGGPAKWMGTHYHNVCGSPECTSKLRSRNNAMNNPEHRQKVRDKLAAFDEEKIAQIREKREMTCLAKFGVRHNWASAELREQGQYKTCADKYGDKNYHNVQQMQQTCQERFGVRSFSQTPEFQSKMWHKFTVNGVSFDSSYEYAFYNFLRCMGVDFEYHPKVKIEYSFAGEEHWFFPDFRIGDRLFEIKGEHLYKYMQIPDTKEYAKLQCILTNNVTIVVGCDVLRFISAVFNIDLTPELIKNHCAATEFPGTTKWLAAHPIWDCYVPGYMDPRSAWHDDAKLERAVQNMIKTINDSLISGKYDAFCTRHIKSLISGDYATKVLDRFTIAKIAPKVTALDETVLLKIIEESGVDLSAGVYCPMAGFGGIVRGVTRWFEDRGLPPDVEAYDINANFCKWYGWTNRDVLAQVIHTNKVVVVCPPFGKQYEHWKGTPDEMSDITFAEWVKLIKAHVIAPNYIFIGPETKPRKNRCGLFAKAVGVSLYKD